VGPVSVVEPIGAETFAAGLDRVREAVADSGTLDLIVARPALAERALLKAAELDVDLGLIGDMWAVKPRSNGDPPTVGRQLTVMGSRAVALVSDSDDPAVWALAGDQLFVDLDLSEANLPAGSRLTVGDALIEVTAEPHLGCGKFVRRYGIDAMKLVNSAEGRALRLRGLNARVVRGGRIAIADEIRKAW
jgi:hypothetical protein